MKRKFLALMGLVAYATMVLSFCGSFAIMGVFMFIGRDHDPIVWSQVAMVVLPLILAILIVVLFSVLTKVQENCKKKCHLAKSKGNKVLASKYARKYYNLKAFCKIWYIAENN